MSTADRIRKFGDQIDSLIYHTKPWDEPESVWYCQLSYKQRGEHSKVEIEVSHQDVDLEVAMSCALMKLEGKLACLRPVRLMPVIEQAKKTSLPRSSSVWCTADGEFGCTKPSCGDCPLEKPDMPHVSRDTS